MPVTAPQPLPPPDPFEPLRLDRLERPPPDCLERPRPDRLDLLRRDLLDPLRRERPELLRRERPKLLRRERPELLRRDLLLRRKPRVSISSISSAQFSPKSKSCLNTVGQIG